MPQALYRFDPIRLEVVHHVLKVSLSVKETATITGKSESRIRQILDEVSRITGPLFTREDDVITPTQIGVEVADIAEEILHRCRHLVGLRDSKPVVLAFLPYHARFVAPAIAHDNVRLEVLDEAHRATTEFQQRAIRPLEAHAFDVVIGPPPERDAQLETVHAYTAHLEAMIPKQEAKGVKSIALEDIIERHDLLLPPSGFRSRELLERYVHDSGLDSALSRLTIKHEAKDTKVLILLGRAGVGTVVVPSDVAYPFKAGHHFGGPDADNFTWVPILHEKKMLTHDVHITHRAESNPATLALVRELLEQTRAERQR